jgi:hypothetical protein
MSRMGALCLAAFVTGTLTTQEIIAGGLSTPGWELQTIGIADYRRTIPTIDRGARDSIRRQPQWEAQTIRFTQGRGGRGVGRVLQISPLPRTTGRPGWEAQTK